MIGEYQPAGKGDEFVDPFGTAVVVKRASARGGWVDIDVFPIFGSTWSKRMPKGIPANWKKTYDARTNR